MRALTGFGLSGITTWGLKQVLPLILLVIGIGIIARSRSGRLSENAATFANVILGVVVILSAGALIAFADEVSSMLTGGG